MIIRAVISRKSIHEVLEVTVSGEGDRNGGTFRWGTVIKQLLPVTGQHNSTEIFACGFGILRRCIQKLIKIDTRFDS
jgi:hypothetical protein